MRNLCGSRWHIRCSVAPALMVHIEHGCLEENALLDLVDGRLSPDALRTVEQHIDACEDCRLLVALASQHDAPGPAERPAPGPGTRLCGRFLLGRMLGKGSTGAVFEARDETLDVDVAIKLLDD